MKDQIDIVSGQKKSWYQLPGFFKNKTFQGVNDRPFETITQYSTRNELASILGNLKYCTKKLSFYFDKKF